LINLQEKCRENSTREELTRRNGRSLVELAGIELEAFGGREVIFEEDD
jgi:hypothetical protein